MLNQNKNKNNTNKKETKQNGSQDFFHGEPEAWTSHSWWEYDLVTTSRHTNNSLNFVSLCSLVHEYKTVSVFHRFVCNWSSTLRSALQKSYNREIRQMAGSERWSDCFEPSCRLESPNVSVCALLKLSRLWCTVAKHYTSLSHASLLCFVWSHHSFIAHSAHSFNPDNYSQLGFFRGYKILTSV